MKTQNCIKKRNLYHVSCLLAKMDEPKHKLRCIIYNDYYYFYILN